MHFFFLLGTCKVGVPQAQAAVGGIASATDQDVTKLTTKLGSGLSTGGREWKLYFFINCHEKMHVHNL